MSMNGQTLDWQAPVASENRTSLKNIALTKIGTFGLRRKARPGVPSHLHTGIDIERPNDNYKNEPVFPAAKGVVISVRNDGPFAQVIIKHKLDETHPIWTVYEHIAGISTCVGDSVFPDKPIARFMNTYELDSLGWQFDHLHFEIMKKNPRPIKPAITTPHRLFGTYSLECYTEDDLKETYHNPIEFLKIRW